MGKLTELPAAAALTGAEKVPVVQDGATRAATVDAIAARGGDATSWTAYTPTLAANSGTFGNASAAGWYKRIGKTVFVNLTITIVTNGGAGAFIKAGLPFPAAHAATIGGREDAAVGFALTGGITAGQSTLRLTRFDAAYPGGDGYSLVMSGIYETSAS